MYELTACIGAAVDADLCHLYLVETEGQLVQFPQTEGPGWAAIPPSSQGGHPAHRAGGHRRRLLCSRQGCGGCLFFKSKCLKANDDKKEEVF